MIAYHGTDKQFDKFDKSYIYTDYAELGYGFYFDTDKTNAESYGDTILKVKLSYNKPFILSKSTYNWLAKNLGEDIIDFEPEIDDLIKLISVDTLRATDLIQSKYDAILVDTQIVVFEPEQIEILERIEETMSIKQLVEKMNEFEDVQVLNQKELINALYKSKIEYRITYDANKDWYLIATAYNHTHEELLYNAAPAYGLNFNQMVDYYNDHYADLFDLIYTPKTEDIKVGFDHNNIAYIFNNFGTIYTKGQELSKVLLNDLTDRFGEANIKHLEESLQENLTKLDFKPNITIADNIDSLVHFLKTNKGEYRITLDRKRGISIICPSKECIHVDSMVYAVDEGWYADYINGNAWDDIDEYFGKGLENGYIELLIFSDKNNYEDYDSIYWINEYPFGYIFTKGENNIPNELKDLIGEPIKTEKVINETLNSFTKNRLKEDLSSWKAGNPTIGERNAKIYELQKELDRLQTLKAELGKEISRISNKYYKQNHCWTGSENWNQADQLKQKNNRKRQDEIMKQINQIQSDIKELRNYQPPKQMSLFSEDVKTNLNQAFWDWFGDSITVDKDGNPLIFYHGTRSDFTEFKTNYADNLVFFSYKKDFADRWGKEKRDYSNEISNDIFDKQDEFKRKLYKEYQAKYGEDFYDNDEYRKELNKELDDNLTKLEKERNVHSRTLGCYLKVHKIFYPEKDYELVLDEICKYYEWQNPNTKEYEEKLKRFEDEYDKANEYWNQWWANNKDADEETIKAEEKKLDDAFKRYSVCKSIKTEFEDNLNRIKKGAWVYFEHGNVIDKIWSLGYDAIQLSERDGEQTTLAVRAGNNQIKSVDNNGTWSKTSENIYEHLNRMFEELL